ncbi:hypothetical protein MANES_03G064500v8 [Manihot esculenta]|uniref:Uncharacterized protein n=2 Tax=Manihot esculenta TaxID=3983 RepID=A0ACB7I0G3_MANES|nr:hypothetical protein MANES_03G064940v8 [Manihot esculenta]OAY54305.1 hypothetical protein MANES_03G064500v8 [Manihot esculenta]
MAMSFKNWRNSSSRETIHLGRNHLQVKDEKDEVKEAKPKWFNFWRKIYREKKKKKKKFASGPVTLQASYDPDEYSQNFDQGTGWTEPDNHSRSFSARFADPSRILVLDMSRDFDDHHDA